MYLGNAKGIDDVDGSFCTDAKRNAIGSAISHVGDLLISRSGVSISFFAKRHEWWFVAKAFVRNELIYLRVQI